MATCIKTGLSQSYAYKRGCRCIECVALKQRYTRQEAPKARERVKKWLKEHPGARTKYNRKYADTKWLEKFGELQEKQNGVCAICKQSVSGMINSKSKLAVDHDHKTGKIRGLLCGSCNIGLGHFKDNIEYLTNAIVYLKENGDVY